MRVLFKIVTGIMLWALPQLATAGTWPTADGKAQLISTTVYITAGHEFDEDGKLSRQANFTKLEDQL